MLVRQLEEELRHQKTRGLSVEVQSQLENLSTENDHLNREVAILRETIKVSLATTPFNLSPTVGRDCPPSPPHCLTQTVAVFRVVVAAAVGC